MGNLAKAKKKLDELERRGRDRYISPLLKAQVLSGLERFDDALDCIARAQEVGATDLIWLRVRPQFEPLHERPAFIAACNRIGI
jgi:hypothetical protein